MAGVEGELESHGVEQEMVIMPLGGGQEVGRSCILLKFRGRTILLDCGIHPGREGMDSCPFFDMVEPEKVDLILISHFHIDHCAALPYFTEKTNFKVLLLPSLPLPLLKSSSSPSPREESS
jgi:cleavage and polyadenylation specificity factor subunit 3